MFFECISFFLFIILQRRSHLPGLPVRRQDGFRSTADDIDVYRVSDGGEPEIHVRKTCGSLTRKFGMIKKIQVMRMIFIAVGVIGRFKR